MRLRILFGLAGLSSIAFAQAPPVQLKTPDIKLPGPLSFPSADPGGIGSAPLTVSEAVAIALRKQPGVNIARANLLQQQGRTQEVASALNPQFSATSGLSNQTGLRNGGLLGGNFTSSTASVSVQQLLFDFQRTRDEVRQQSAIERSTLSTLKRTFQTVELQVKLAFYDLVQSRASVATGQANMVNRQRQLDQAQARATSGLGAPVDVVQAKTNLADAAISLSFSRNQEISSRIALALILGIDSRTPLNLADSGEPVVPDEGDLEKLVGIALSKRLDIVAAREQVTASHIGIGVARKGNVPSVAATAGVNSVGQGSPLTGQAGVVGINLGWTFGDGGLTRGRVKEAVAGEQIARESVIAVSNQAVADVSQAFTDLQSALQRVELATSGTANAKELVRSSEVRYAGGIGLFIDITNAQNSLFAAETNLTQAQQDVERARARLRAAIGV